MGALRTLMGSGHSQGATETMGTEQAIRNTVYGIWNTNAEYGIRSIRFKLSVPMRNRSMYSFKWALVSAELAKSRPVSAALEIRGVAPMQCTFKTPTMLLGCMLKAFNF
jgi:hypothetical protein